MLQGVYGYEGDDVAAEKGQLSQTGWGMSALFLQCSGMRANQSAAAVYIASSLFWRLLRSTGVCGILSGIDVLCVRQGGRDD